MNPWQALLESLHSSFMDEIRARLGDSKTLELGMPKAFPGWGLPDSTLEVGCLARVELAGHSGWAIVAAATDSKSWAKGSVDEYWQGTLSRAAKEFSKRGIRPVLAASSPWQSSKGFPGGDAPARLIWMPVKVQGRAVAVAVGR